MPNPQPDDAEMLILETAINLFAEKGFNDTKLIEIQRKTGISKNILYHYFAGKREILDCVLEQIWQKLADIMMDLAEDKILDPLEKIDAMIDKTIDIFAHNPNLALVFYNEHNPRMRGQNDSLNAHYIHYLKAFAQIFNAGIRGNFIDEKTDGRVFLFYISGGLRNIINEWSLTPQIFEISKVREQIKHLVKHGILKW
jgi:AcrR family transcriptional regulator